MEHPFSAERCFILYQSQLKNCLCDLFLHLCFLLNSINVFLLIANIDDGSILSFKAFATENSSYYNYLPITEAVRRPGGYFLVTA